MRYFCEFVRYRLKREATESFPERQRLLHAEIARLPGFLRKECLMVQGDPLERAEIVYWASEQEAYAAHRQFKLLASSSDYMACIESVLSSGHYCAAEQAQIPLSG